MNCHLDVIWLHVTCAGGWTKKLYENVKQQVEIEKQKLSVSIDGEISQVKISYLILIFCARIINCFYQASNEVDFKGKNQKGEIPSVSKSLENVHKKQ